MGGFWGFGVHMYNPPFPPAPASPSHAYTHTTQMVCCVWTSISVRGGGGKISFISFHFVFVFFYGKSPFPQPTPNPRGIVPFHQSCSLFFGGGFGFPTTHLRPCYCVYKPPRRCVVGGVCVWRGGGWWVSGMRWDAGMEDLVWKIWWLGEGGLCSVCLFVSSRSPSPPSKTPPLPPPPPPPISPSCPVHQRLAAVGH